MDDADLVIIGAGLYGITTAITYHRLHPTARILILESAPYIGGPWAPHRVFPGLRANNLWGTYQHPDFPMDEERFGVRRGEHVPAEKMYEYLESLMKDGDVDQFLRLNTRVEVIEKYQGAWKLQCINHGDSNHQEASPSSAETQQLTITTEKLVVSVGLTNQPSMPQYTALPSFSPMIIHSNEFGPRYHDIVKPNSHTLVIGSGKSAWDVAYACCQEPSASATMLIRPSGNGPVWMSPPHVTPLKLWLEKLVFTRLLGYMSPCPFAETTGFEGWTRSFLHGTWLGRKIVGAFWWILGNDVVQLNKYNEHEEVKKLRPWRDVFEVGNALSIMNYPTNFLDLVRQGRIKVMVDELSTFAEGKQVSLESGQTIEVDAVVCATGWKIGHSVKFKPESLEGDLGLPSTRPPSEEDALLIRKVESELYTRYPYLKTRDSSRVHHPNPSLRFSPSDSYDQQQPYRLYRFIAPPSDIHSRSIAFAGAVTCVANTQCAYLQSLWLTAYLDGTLTFPSSTSSSSDQIRYETYINSQYCKMRGAMGYGKMCPDLAFDSLPYFDVLMRDLGYGGKRKGGWGALSWFRECVRSYGPEDYTGLVSDWREKSAAAIEEKKRV